MMGGNEVDQHPAALEEKGNVAALRHEHMNFSCLHLLNAMLYSCMECAGAGVKVEAHELIITDGGFWPQLLLVLGTSLLKLGVT